MNDTISRQAAIDAVNSHRYVYENKHLNDYEQGWNDACDYCADEWLDDLPSAQPKPKWIPVSERLPEETDGTVLVCMSDESPYNEREPFINAKHNQQVETATYSQHSDTWYFAMGAVSSARPIAWMHLPKPYERSEDD